MSDPPPPEALAAETLELGDRNSLRVSGFCLRVTHGLDVGRSVERSGDRTVIGSQETADLCLTDPAVSRFHCEIVSHGRSLLVRDLGSTNGTYVDGTRVLEAFVAPGATLTLGQTVLQVEPTKRAVELDLWPSPEFGVMVGRSPAMRRAFSLLARAAKSQASVLLSGETGTGKEAAAESIHRESERADGPFIVVDCGAVPANLLESELFGHEKGAFTGAHQQRKGAFEAARGGTIFLDEIGELDGELQPKLLRVLEKREIKRLGSNEYAPVDVRVVAATHRNLRADVNSKRFRPDLYYRLAVIEVTLPPLRDRAEDLPLLLSALLEATGLSAQPEAVIVRDPSFTAKLLKHSWPGNVRELRNYVERCVALNEEAALEPLELAAESRRWGALPGVDIKQPLKIVRSRAIAQVEHAYLVAIMAAHEGNVTAAARAAGVDRIHFYRLLWRHGLK